jgi:molybdate transport system ATP-binding protein
VNVYTKVTCQFAFKEGKRRKSSKTRIIQIIRLYCSKPKSYTNRKAKTVSKPFITLENITLNLNGELLFKDTNWIWQTDQHWAIIGPNGSGKSTLAKAICRQIPLYQGKIYYFFNERGNVEPFFNRSDIIMISPGMHQELMYRYGGYHQARWQSSDDSDIPSVAEFLSGKSIEHRSPYEVTAFKTSEAVYRSRREKAMALLEIEYLLERKIHQLSNGETRKVLIARALMQAPKLLIFDDPFGGVDTESRNLLRKVFAGLIAAGEMKILLINSGPDELPEGITHLLYVVGHQVIEQKPINQNLTAVHQNETPSVTQPAISFSGLFPDLKRDFGLESSVLVEMKDTSVCYNGVTVLAKVNWSVREGQRWAVLGHNGAGKSTLLSLITGDNPQVYANEVSLFGKKRGSGESIWDIKKQIGWVSPELQIYYTRGFSCLEVVCSGFFDSIGLYQSCTPEQIADANEWLQLFQIDKLADRLFNSLSLGEQRLTLLARALVKKPSLLVLDEPCQGLDEMHRKYINNLLDQLCRQTDQSMIYVTHYLDELPQTITHILKLKNGRVIENTVR